MAEAKRMTTDRLRDRPGAWVDLGLTLPIFLVYHLGVVFLGVQNATDLVTGTLLSLSAGDRSRYLLATLAIGVVFAGTFALLGRGQAFRPRKFVQVIVEGVIYSVVMAFAGNAVVGSLFAGPGAIGIEGPFVGLIMSLGAGFYEELAFRVLLFGIGAKILVWAFAGQRYELSGTSAGGSGLSLRSGLVMLLWAVVCALIFSGVHYIGPLGDAFVLTSFTYRAVLGLILTLIYVTRGFATAVWTHAIYDIWVLVFLR